MTPAISLKNSFAKKIKLLETNDIVFSMQNKKIQPELRVRRVLFKHFFLMTPQVSALDRE